MKGAIEESNEERLATAEGLNFMVGSFSLASPARERTTNGEEVNEDKVIELPDAVGTLDGMGGTHGGNEASQKALDNLRAEFVRMNPDCSAFDMAKAISTAISFTSDAVYATPVFDPKLNAQFSNKDILSNTKKGREVWKNYTNSDNYDPNDTRDMHLIGSTINVLKLAKVADGSPIMFSANIGDSRSYLYRNGELCHISLDDSYYSLRDILEKSIGNISTTGTEENKFATKSHDKKTRTGEGAFNVLCAKYPYLDKDFLWEKILGN